MPTSTTFGLYRPAGDPVGTLARDRAFLADVRRELARRGTPRAAIVLATDLPKARLVGWTSGSGRDFRLGWLVGPAGVPARQLSRYPAGPAAPAYGIWYDEGEFRQLREGSAPLPPAAVRAPIVVVSARPGSAVQVETSGHPGSAEHIVRRAVELWPGVFFTAVPPSSTSYVLRVDGHGIGEWHRG